MTQTMRIGVFNSEYRTNNYYIINAISAAFMRHPRVSHCEVVEFHTWHQVLSKRNLDALIVIGSAANVHWQLPIWRAAGVRTVFWSTEDPYELTNNLIYQDKFDLIFTNDLASLPLYRIGTGHLPLAGATEYHDLIVSDKTELSYDILFVGTAWPNRVEDLNWLLEHLSAGNRTRLKIGFPSNPHIPLPTIIDPHLIYDWRCSPTAFAKLANRSAVTLTLGRNFSGSSGEVRGSTPPPRLFELGLAGAAQVFITTSREIEIYYDIEQEIITQPSIQTAIEPIKLLLADADRRYDLACAMQARTRRDHTYDQRIDRIIERIWEIGRLSAPKLAAEATENVVGKVKRRRILLVAHNLEGRMPGGGVEVYLTSIRRVLCQVYDVFLLIPGRLENRTILELVLPEGVSVRYETRSIHSSEYISVPEIEEILFNIILRHGIELVHFHHLLGWPLSLPIIAKLAGAATIFTVHDHYLICDNFNLISHEKEFCEFHRKSQTYCDVCLNNTKGFNYGSQVIRRNVVSRILKSIDLIIFNTNSSRSLMRQVYSIQDSSSAIIEMLMPGEGPCWKPFAKEIGPVKDDSGMLALSVKIPGNFTAPKAAVSVFHVMQSLRDDNIMFEILGREDGEVAQLLDAASNPRVRRRGGYEQNEISALLAGGDVSINFSIWPETFMISLSESWAAGVIPIVSDLGAPAERVTDGVDGFVVPHNDFGRIVELLRLLNQDRERVDVMRETIAKKHVMRSREHGSILIDHYERLLAPGARPNSVAANEHIYFDRAMYAQRYTNNKWTDVATLWDREYDRRHLSLIHDIQQTPRFPISDIPMKYRHLPRIEIDNRAERKVEIVPKGLEALEQRENIVIRIYPTSGRALVEGLLRFAVDGAFMLVPLVLNESRSTRSYLASGRVPELYAIKKFDVICVHDGEIVVFLDVGSNIVDDENLFMLEDRERDVGEVEYVEGCDRIADVFVREGKIQITGWAFEPLTNSVPLDCRLLIEDDFGLAWQGKMKRVQDNDYADIEPMLAYSGAAWEHSLDDFERVMSAARPSELTFRIIQRVGSRVLSSGCTVTVRVDDLRKMRGKPILLKRTFDSKSLQAVVAALQTLNPNILPETAEDQAKVLIDGFDQRMLLTHSSGRELAEEDYKNKLVFYILKGEPLGFCPHVDFDPSVYAARNPEISQQHPLFLHYLLWGRNEGRSASARKRPFICEDAEIVRPFMNMDYYHYQAFGNNQFSGDLAQHYVAYGEGADLRPNEEFDPAYYRRVNSDLLGSSKCLFAHYLTYGIQEGRRASETSNIKSRHTHLRAKVQNAFDFDYYTSQVPYLLNTDIDPICHFFEFGAGSGLSPNRKFEKDMEADEHLPMAELFMSWCQRFVSDRA